MKSVFMQTLVASVLAGLILWWLTNTNAGLKLLYTIKPLPGANQ